jgi:hypothetical protein
MSGYKGFFYHFLDMKTGERFDDSELSTVDTALLLAGALFCQSYFDGAQPEEVEIRRLVDQIYRRVDWRWAQPHAPAISLGWSPEDGFLEYDWRGYNEAMLVYVLALGSPTSPVGTDAWGQWTSTYDQTWHKNFGQEYLGFASLFGHQYSQVWLDFRQVQDAYMRKRGIDYFENTRRAIYAQRAYAIENPLRCKDYGASMWGITASDGPGDFQIESASGKRVYRAYTARGIGARGRARRLHPSRPRRPSPRFRLRRNLRFPLSSICIGASASTSMGLTDSSMRSIRASRSPTSSSATAAAFRLRLGRRGLSRHRPGRARRDDRELPQRAHLERDAPERVRAPRPYARRLLGRVAHRVRPVTRCACGRRRFASLLLVMGAAVLGAGCGERATDVTVVRFWAMGREGEIVTALLPEFERTHPRIRVDVQQLPWTAAHEKLLTAFAGDATPDLCQLGNTWIPEFVALGALQPLDASIARSSVDPHDFFAGIWDTNVVGGQVYGVPWYVTRVFCSIGATSSTLPESPRHPFRGPSGCARSPPSRRRRRLAATPSCCR